MKTTFKKYFKTIILSSVLLFILTDISFFNKRFIKKIYRTLRYYTSSRQKRKFLSRTLKNVKKELSAKFSRKIQNKFKEKNINFPPEKICFIVIKNEKIMELWAGNSDEWVFIDDYIILAASGVSGPKIKEGDRQVPEGIYKIDILNPQSQFHLSMRINYPNGFDRLKASEENRTGLGGDIYIHGSNCSIGCLAMGDDVIEELFHIVSETGMEATKILIMPNDFRIEEPVKKGKYNFPWIQNELYENLKTEIKCFNKKD